MLALLLASLSTIALADETAPAAPAPEAAPAAPVVEVDKSDGARKFLSRRLEVAPLRVTTVTTNQYGGVVSSNSVDTWTVYQGQNTMVTAKGFAEAVNDTATLEKMKKERIVGTAIGAPMTVAGLGLATYGIIEGTAHPYKSSMWILGGTIGGGLLTGLGIVVWTGPAGKQRWPVRYYTEDQATEFVDGYNKQLMTDLNVSKEDVITYIKSRSEIKLEVQPFIASNMVGVTGTF